MLYIKQVVVAAISFPNQITTHTLEKGNSRFVLKHAKHYAFNLTTSIVCPSASVIGFTINLTTNIVCPLASIIGFTINLTMNIVVNCC